MVNPFVVAAAASATIGAAVAFEMGVFRPWREDNWPHGLREGIKVEVDKLKREFEEGLHELREDIRDGIRGRRRPRRSQQDRLTDAELDEFRRHADGRDPGQHQITGRGLVGKSRSSSSETLRSEFEMHERQSSAYRAHLASSMGYGASTGVDNQRRSTLRHRHNDSDISEDCSLKSPARPHDPYASPEAPQHALGDASPSMTDSASLTQLDDQSSDDGSMTPLTAASPQLPRSLLFSADLRHQDPFGAGDSFHGAAVSSWQAVFDRDQEQALDNGASHGSRTVDLASADQTRPERSRTPSSDGFAEVWAPSTVSTDSLVDVGEPDGVGRAASPSGSQRSNASISASDDFVGSRTQNGASSEGQGSQFEFRSLSLYLDAQQSVTAVDTTAAAARPASVQDAAARSDLLSDEEAWLPLEASPSSIGHRRRLTDSDEESWAELGGSASDSD